jgi:hypothetical protein
MQGLISPEATASIAGTVHPTPALPGRIALPILHPAFVVRGMWPLEPAQTRFLRRAWQLAQQPADALPRAIVDVREPPPGANPTPTLDDLRHFVATSRGLADRRMACDIEGTGGRLIGIGWCRLADEQTIYVPFLDADAPYWHDHEWPEVDGMVRELLAFPLIMHNGQSFDVPFLESLDAVYSEIEELEDGLDDWPPRRVRVRLVALRHELLHTRRTVAATRGAVRRVLDGRIEVGDHALFPPNVERLFADTYETLVRVAEELDIARDLLAGVRDHHQSKVVEGQGEVAKKLTVIASLVLVPSFIVGYFGQNCESAFDDAFWSIGVSTGLIVVSTIIQLAIFRWRRWI